MAGDLTATRTKVQQILTQNFTDVIIDKDNDFTLRNGSSRIFVRTWTRDDVDWTIVGLWIPLLTEVKETPELFEHLALHADDYIFGHLNATRRDGGIMISLNHNLLGEYLDSDELTRSVGGMLGVADELDDELRNQFGGKRFHEE